MPNEVDSLKIDLELCDALGERKRFTTFKSLANFIESERTFWQSEVAKFSNHEPFNKILNCFNTANQEAKSYVSNFPSCNESTRQQQLNQLIANIRQRIPNAVFSQTPFAVGLVETSKIGQPQAYAFWVAVTGKGQLQNNSFQSLEGAILGYEFIHQDESIIYKRRDSERRAFTSLRKTLADQTDEIIGHIDDFKNEINEWKINSQEELIVDRESYKSEQNEFLSSAAEKLENQLTKDKNDRETFFTIAKKQIDDLEALYREKLRLEPAATYWNKRATELRNAGRRWGAMLALATIATGTFFGWLFKEWMASGKVIDRFTAMHWQGIVLLVAMVTMFIFLIRVLGKMTFSSFHLQRDAEERELLSYLYLALSEKGTLDDESRKVVLQSLFSRAETGLLSGDHGPTIPAAEVLQKLK